MEKFNFGLINKSNVLIGDVRIIVSINGKNLRMLKSCDSLCGDYTSACKTLPAKDNAILLRVDDKHFIDIDSINCADDCDQINELLNSNSVDNNMFMTLGTDSPYIGQLYLTNMRTYAELENSVTDIVKLKLINKDTQ